MLTDCGGRFNVGPKANASERSGRSPTCQAPGSADNDRSKRAWPSLFARTDEVVERAQRPLASLPPGARASRELRLVEACSGEQSRQEIVTQRAEDGDPRTRALRGGVVGINRNHIMMRRILSGMIGVLMRQGEVTAW